MFAVRNAGLLLRDFEPVPALVIPYVDPRTGDLFTYGDGNEFARVRYLEDVVARSGFKGRKLQRYSQPAGSGMFAYFPVTAQFEWSDVLADTSTPIIVTEGEKKALAACLAGIPCVGLGGVFNFAQGGELIESLRLIDWRRRPVYFCFDSDAARNPNIQAAEGRLAQELSVRQAAQVHLVRLPQGERKVGIDDFIVANGADAFFDVIENGVPMRKIDAEVLALNEHVAYIERDAVVWDLQARIPIQKHSFCNGSKYSARTVLQPTVKGTGVKEVSVTEKWLRHPHAQRYMDIVFRPDVDAPAVETEGGAVLNTWAGFEREPGDVKPFLELTDFLFSDLPPEHRALAFDVLTYKFQNPSEKVPLALVLLGPQGCGKTMWASIIRDAVKPYGYELPSSALVSEFNGYVERSIIAVINEAQAAHVKSGYEILRQRISEDTDFLNEKFRVPRQVPSYTFYILTSNDRAVGSYDNDDRRMFVVSCPHPREKAFYDKIGAWWKAGGPAKLMDYMLSRDLKGWKPPARAPLTQEKQMAYLENLTLTQRIAEDMRTATEHTVVLWINQAMEWASTAEVSNDPGQARYAREIQQSLAHIQIKPWYTPEELALMFPAIVGQLYSSKRYTATGPGEISRQLRNAGVPILPAKDNPRGFLWRGRWSQYLVVAQMDEWASPLSQADFERYMGNWPTYSQYIEMLDTRKRKK
jgi:hypothetical protein